MQAHHMDETNTSRRTHGRAGEKHGTRLIGGHQTPGLGVGDGDEELAVALAETVSSANSTARRQWSGLTLSSSASRYCRARW